MARITVEDCLKQVDNMYDLVLVATNRVRQLTKGSDATVKCKNRLPVVALREIAAGHITTENLIVGEKNSDEMAN